MEASKLDVVVEGFVELYRQGEVPPGSAEKCTEALVQCASKMDLYGMGDVLVYLSEQVAEEVVSERGELYRIFALQYADGITLKILPTIAQASEVAAMGFISATVHTLRALEPEASHSDKLRALGKALLTSTEYTERSGNADLLVLTKKVFEGVEQAVKEDAGE